MTPFGALGWAVASTFGFYVLVDLFRGFADGSIPNILTLALLSALSYLLATFGVLRVHDPECVSLRASLGLRRTHPALLLVGVTLGLSLKLPAEALRDWMEQLVPSEPAELEMRAELLRVDDGLGLFQLVVAACLIAPVIEEVFFRGALYGRLVSASALKAAVVSGALFVLAHPDPRDFPALVLVAAVLGFVRALGGSMLPTLALHMSFNLAGVLGLVAGWTPVDGPTEISPEALLASIVSLSTLLPLTAWLARAESTSRARWEDMAS